MTDPHAELAKYDAAIAEHEARQLADEIGYTFGMLTDGTIVLEPPDAFGAPTRVLLGAGQHWPTHGPDGDACAKCGKPLDALNRCQNIINRAVPEVNEQAFRIEYVCPEHMVRD